MFPWTSWSCNELEDHTIEDLTPAFMTNMHGFENSHLAVQENIGKVGGSRRSSWRYVMLIPSGLVCLFTHVILLDFCFCTSAVETS